MFGLKIETNLIIISYKIFYRFHKDNDVSWSLFQIQNKWRTEKLKEEAYGALNPDRNIPAYCIWNLKFVFFLQIIQWIFIFIMYIMIFSDNSVKYKTIWSPEYIYQYLHVVLGNLTLSPMGGLRGPPPQHFCDCSGTVIARTQNFFTFP